MAVERRNKNRGYQQLRVWEDAIELYGLAWRAIHGWPFEMKKLASQSLSSSDSVHRNIAEGYCRRSFREYVHHLNFALGSPGETLSGFIAYAKNDQIDRQIFEQLDVLIIRLENRLLKLVEALERKRDNNDWHDTLLVKADHGNSAVAPEVLHDLNLFSMQ